MVQFFWRVRPPETTHLHSRFRRLGFVQSQSKETVTEDSTQKSIKMELSQGEGNYFIPNLSIVILIPNYHIYASFWYY